MSSAYADGGIEVDSEMATEINRMAVPMPIQMRQSAEAAPTSVVVLDPIGGIFERIRELGLPATTWRVVDPRRLAKGLRVGLAVYASYGELEWESVERLDECGPTVLITTAYQRSEAAEALRRDLVGYLDAALPREPLGRALRSLLLRREHAFPRDVVGSWLWQQRLGKRAEGGPGGLTRRQHEIVTLIARGATDKEIGATLGIATATAQKHVTNILQRLHVPNRAAAAATMAGRRLALS